MTNEKIKEIIEKHQHWIKEDCEGWEDMRADLRRAKLCWADQFRLGKVLDEPVVTAFICAVIAAINKDGSFLVVSAMTILFSIFPTAVMVALYNDFKVVDK